MRVLAPTTINSVASTTSSARTLRLCFIPHPGYRAVVAAAVPAVALGPVKGLVRLVQQVFLVYRVVRVGGGAHADGYRDAPALQGEPVLLYSSPYSLRHLHHALPVGVGKERHELLAAVTGRDVDSADSLPQYLSHPLE